MKPDLEKQNVSTTKRRGMLYRYGKISCVSGVKQIEPLHHQKTILREEGVRQEKDQALTSQLWDQQ